jgi:3-hydroxyacyl-CoA dehydrogenase
MAIRKVGVIGAGLMGHGIAQVAAQGGCDVVVCETQQGFLDKGLERIDKSLSKLAEKAKEKGQTFDAAAVRGKIRGTLSKQDLADCDLVVEAIVEDLEVKKTLFAELGKIVKKDAIFASNTSSFPIAEMAAVSGRADRFVGLHFFNPVACGKTPITCKDTPGFVVNRLLVPYMAEAMKLAERGDASIPDIDVAMKLGCGYPMGPFELTDYVGLDTTLSILQGWVKRYPSDPAFQIPKLLEAKVKEGKLGRKSGQGFYTWQGDKRV